MERPVSGKTADPAGKPADQTGRVAQVFDDFPPAAAPDPGFSVVVPTNGESAMLLPLLDAVGPRGLPVVVWTTAEPIPEEIELRRAARRLLVVVDAGSLNIQRWWNNGIRAAGRPVAVVVNDDVRWGPGDPEAMADLRGATLSMVAGHRMTGWCFGVDTRHGILPDERFQWWYGDDDILLRAKEEGAGVRWVEGTRIQHAGTRGLTHPDLAHITARDRRQFDRKRAGSPVTEPELPRDPKLAAAPRGGPLVRARRV
jgi:hypothetical protein